jgi:RHS repeat-associated protein
MPSLALTNTTGAVTDTYDAACPERGRRNASGNLVHSTGTTPNVYLFSGEQYDPDLGLYYNRARYLNVNTGRFWTRDEYEGYDEAPPTLQEYVYISDNPVNEVDPSGKQGLSTTVYGNIVHKILEDDFLDYLEEEEHEGFVEENIGAILGKNIPLGLGGLIPDMVDLTAKEIYEIKSAPSAPEGAAKIALYLYALNRFDKSKGKWKGGTSFRPRAEIRLSPVTIAFVTPPILDLIVYEVTDIFELYFLARVAYEDMVAGLYVETSTAQLVAVEGGG